MTNIVMRIPTSEEWDKMMDICKDDNTLTHWRDILSWVNDTREDSELESSCRVYRGFFFSRFWDCNDALHQASYIGFRPAIEGLSSDFQTDDITVVGTLYMNGEPVCVPSKPSAGGDITNYVQGAKLELREALPDPAYQIKAIKVGDIYIADRVLLKRISYEEIQQALEVQTPFPTETNHATSNKETQLSTPHGLLRAYISGNDECPEIRIELEKGQNPDDHITLALVKSVPGGEAFSDNNPSNTTGFVTYTWPHDFTYTTCDENENIQTITHCHPPVITSWISAARGYVGNGKTREAADADLVQKVEADTAYRGLTMIAKHLGYSVYTVDTDGYCYPMDRGIHQGIFCYADEMPSHLCHESSSNKGIPSAWVKTNDDNYQYRRTISLEKGKERFELIQIDSYDDAVMHIPLHKIAHATICMEDYNQEEVAAAIDAALYSDFDALLEACDGDNEKAIGLIVETLFEMNSVEYETEEFEHWNDARAKVDEIVFPMEKSGT